MRQEKRFPLEVLIVGSHYCAVTTAAGCLTEIMRHHPAVAAIGCTEDMEEAQQLIKKGIVNTIVVCLQSQSPQVWIKELEKFIFPIRDQHPSVVFIIGVDAGLLRDLETHLRLKNYWRIQFQFPFMPPAAPAAGPIPCVSAFEEPQDRTTPLAVDVQEVDQVIRLCEKWHHDRFEYDIAISYASEDLGFAEAIAKRLRSDGVRVFFDRFESPDLAGRDLDESLGSVFSKKARYVLMLISKSYVKKGWPRRECAVASDRSHKERGRPYILPVRMDNARIDSLKDTVCSFRKEEGISKIARVVVRKLWLCDPHHEAKLLPTRH